MRNQPSTDPRDQAIRAALRDVAVLAAIAVGDFYATYGGPERTEYLRVLGAYVAVVGGRLEPGPDGSVAVFDDRWIAIRFGSRRGEGQHGRWDRIELR